jgi:hypothetical protein
VADLQRVGPTSCSLGAERFQSEPLCLLRRGLVLVHLHPQAALSWHAQSGQGKQRNHCYLGAHGLQLRFCYDSGIRHVARSKSEQAYSELVVL